MKPCARGYVSAGRLRAANICRAGAGRERLSNCQRQLGALHGALSMQSGAQK